LDSLFGRPSKSKGGTISSGTLTHGGRPVSQDNYVVPGVEDFEQYIQQLSVAELDAKFLEIIEDMNIPKDKREPLLAKSKEERQKMLLWHLKGKEYYKKVNKSMFVYPCRYQKKNVFNLLRINIKPVLRFPKARKNYKHRKIFTSS